MLIALKPKVYVNPDLVASVHEAEYPDGPVEGKTTFVLIRMINGTTYSIGDKTVEEMYQIISKNSRSR